MRNVLNKLAHTLWLPPQMLQVMLTGGPVLGENLFLQIKKNIHYYIYKKKPRKAHMSGK